MKHFFELHNNVALKFQEIQLKFIDGIGYLIKKHEENPFDIKLDSGLLKLYKLKEYYETQLQEAASESKRVQDLDICFRCFDKPNGECHDCD